LLVAVFAFLHFAFKFQFGFHRSFLGYILSISLLMTYDQWAAGLVGGWRRADGWVMVGKWEGIPDWIPIYGIWMPGPRAEDDAKGNKRWWMGGQADVGYIVASRHCVGWCFVSTGGHLSRGGLVMGDLAVADADIVCSLPCCASQRMCDDSDAKPRVLSFRGLWLLWVNIAVLQ
jgi:hypothetical protein